MTDSQYTNAPDAAPKADFAAPQAGYAAPQAGYAAPEAGYATPQAGYATAQAGYAGGSTADQPKTLSLISLIAGIAAWVIGGGMSILFPIAGIVLGVMGRKREPAGRTMATWGLWLSIASLVVGVILWVVIGGVLIASFAAIAAGTSYGSY